MKVTRIGSPPPTDADAPIFRGAVRAQPLVAEEARQLRLGAITFVDGARTRLHHHDYDQVLVITDGQGILATEAEEHAVSPGDVIFVPAGERHWHGARSGASMTHVSVNTVGTTTIDEA
jgi:quercetin dioxygenase-like cupin family protein